MSTFSARSMRSISTRSQCHVTAQQQNKPWRITRGAPPSYKLPILKALLAEKLNPLSLDMERFVIATTATPERQQQEKLIGFGQLKPLDSTSLELSSLVVQPEYRGQGLGKALVAELLATSDPSKTIFLITVTARQRFYEECGFQLVPVTNGVPLSLQIEKLIGTPIAQLAAQDSLIIMKWNYKK